MRQLERGLQDPIAQRNTDVLNEEFRAVHKIVRRFENASAAAVTVQLPDGNIADFDYIVAKVDASVNTVTILSHGTQTIIGASSRVLAAQYDCDYLVFDRETQIWFIV